MVSIRTSPYKTEYEFTPKSLVGYQSASDTIAEAVTGTSVEEDLSFEQILGDIWDTIISAAGMASEVIETWFESPEATELLAYGPISLPRKSAVDFNDALDDFQRILRESHMRSLSTEEEQNIEKRFQKIFASLIELNEREKSHLVRSIELFQTKQEELYAERNKLLAEHAEITDSAKHWDEFHYIVSAVGMGASGFAINPLVGFITTTLALGIIADHLLGDPLKKSVSEILFPDNKESQKDCVMTLEGGISILSTVAAIAMGQFAILKALSGLSTGAYQISKMYHDGEQRKLNVDMTHKDFFLDGVQRSINEENTNFRNTLQAYYQSSKQLQDIISRQKSAARLFIGSIK